MLGQEASDELVDDERFLAVTEEIDEELMATVKEACGGAQQLSNAGHQGKLGRLNDEMESRANLSGFGDGVKILWRCRVWIPWMRGGVPEDS